MRGGRGRGKLAVTSLKIAGNPPTRSAAVAAAAQTGCLPVSSLRTLTHGAASPPALQGPRGGDCGKIRAARTQSPSERRVSYGQYVATDQEIHKTADDMHITGKYTQEQPRKWE